MTQHTLTLVNSGATGDALNLARVEVEGSLADGGYGNTLTSLFYSPNRFLSSSLSTAIFDDTTDEIQWGPGWVSAPGSSNFYNTTIQYVRSTSAYLD